MMESKAATTPDIRKEFQQAGFEVIELGQNPESFEVKKGSCTIILQRDRSGQWVPVGPPHFLVRGVKCELEDHGYQKFWHSEGKRFPIRQRDLKVLHQFEEEVRAICGLRALYHESLGTTCARSAYDRLTGRPEKL